MGRDDVGEQAAPVGEGGLERDGDGAAVRAQAGVAVCRAACRARRTTRGIRADNRGDLAVPRGRRVVIRLAADVGIGGVPALGLPVVDEVIRRDRRAVGPDGLGVQGVDDGLRVEARLHSALEQLVVEDRLELVVHDEGLRPHHVHDLLQDELGGRRGIDVEPGQGLVQCHRRRPTARRRRLRWRAARGWCESSDRRGPGPRRPRRHRQPASSRSD